MDIKQALNATAIITLSKDMTFRDYAQGAFRMRGIGAGQTLRIYMIPEVKKLIISQLAAAAGASASEQHRILAADPATLVQPVTLTDICAWLVINSMRTEKTQFHMLVRKHTHAHARPCTHIPSMSSAAAGCAVVSSLSVHARVFWLCVTALSFRWSNPLRICGASTRSWIFLPSTRWSARRARRWRRWAARPQT